MHLSGNESAPTVERRVPPPPNALDHRSFLECTVLFIGAPYVGKSDRAEELANNLNAQITTDLHDITTLSETDPVVVDEFYKTLQRANEDETEAFYARLQEEDTAGTWVFTRPRALDWLLDGGAKGAGTSDATYTADDGFQAELLGSFDRIVDLRFDPAEPEDEALAVNRCVEIGTDIEADGTNTGLDSPKVKQYLSDLEYRYEFEYPTLDESLGQYRSYVPPLVAYLSTTDSTGGLLGDGLANACRDLAANFSAAEFISNISDIATEILTPEGLGTVGLSLATGPAFGAAASLLLWFRLHTDNVDADAVLEAIADGRLTPTAKAELEARLDLPPRTVENVEKLSREENLARVQELCDEAPERLNSLEAQIEAFESREEEQEQRLDELESTLQNLRNDQLLSNALVSAHIKRSTRRLNRLREELEKDEAALLDPVVAHEAINIDAIELYDGTPTPVTVGSGIESSTDRDRIQVLVNQIKSSPLTILKGPHGTGKTTAAYQACRILETEGYAVRLPNLRDTSPGFLREVLSRYDPGGDQPLVLFASYGFGAGGAQITTQGMMSALFEWIEADICEAVVLECRSELYGSLQSEATTGEQGTRDVNTWKEKTVFEFEPFDEAEPAERLVHWVSEQAGQSDELDQATVDQIVGIAEGNPEITKIATRFALSEDQSLRDIQSAEDLVREDLQNLFGTSQGDRGETWELFKHLAICGQLTTEEIKEFLGTDAGDLKRFEEVRGYLRRESTEEGEELWQLSPSLYRTAVFQRCLNPDGATTSPFEEVLERLLESERDVDRILPKISQNFAVAYKVAQTENSGSGISAATCRTAAESFLHNIAEDDQRSLFMCLSIIVSSHIPMPPSLLEQNVERLMIESEDLPIDRSPAALAALLGNALIAQGPTSLDQDWMDVVKTFEEAVSESYDIDPPAFRGAVFGYASSRTDNRDMMISGFGEMMSETADSDDFDVSKWEEMMSELFDKMASEIERGWKELDEADDSDISGIELGKIFSRGFAELLLPAAESVSIEKFTTHVEASLGDSMRAFIDKPIIPLIYGTVLSGLIQHGPPEEFEQNIEAMLEQAGNTLYIDSPSELPMLAEVYGVAIADLANQGPPEEFEEWIGILFKNANGEVHNIAIKQTGGIFLPLIYARTVSHLASHGSVDEFQEWIDVLLDRAKKSAINNPHGEEPVLFLGQVYTIAISHVARRGPPEEFDGWVEMLLKRAEVALDETHSDEETQWFLHWFYGNTLAQLPLQKVSAKNDWAELLLNKAVAVAAHEPDDSAKFIELVYSVAIAIISDAANPEVAEFMPSEFAEKVSYEGLGEYVELLFKFAGGISIDGFRADEKFQARVLAISVIHTSPSNPLRQGGHSQFLSNRVESGYDADSLAEFYRSFLSVLIKGVLEENDISPDWLSWLIHDARKRSIEVTNKDRHTRESAELLGVVAGAIASAIQAGLPKGLDSDPGREVVSAAASVSEENIELIDSVVTAATNEIHGEFDTEVDYSRSSGGEDETVREFTAQVYAAAVGFHGQAAVANDDAVSTLYQNALSRGEVFEDQSAYLREFHLDALIRLSEGADSTDSPVWHDRMFDRAYSETNMSLADLASAYLTQLAESDDHETGWLAWVIVEATERVATDAGDETLLINLAADAVDAIWQEEVDLRQSTEFDRVVSAVNRLETFNDISRIEVIKGVKKRLEDEHLNEIAALDWKQAFD